MRKLAFASVILAAVIVLSGCTQIAQGRAEINRIFITRIFSIDEAKEGKIMITLTTKSLSTGTGGQQPEQKGESVVSLGDTVFDAERDLLIYLDKRPHYGHTEYILFGEALAKKGILPYLDFISRESEFRYSAKMYIVKGDTANAVVKKANTSKMFIGDRMATIEENIRSTSLSSTVTLNEAMLILDRKNLDTFIPYIELTNTMSSEEKKDKYDVLMRGYAIFRHDKLIYFTSRKEARGINWMMNRIGSGAIIVKNKSGEEISLEIIAGNVKLKPKLEGDKLSCTVEVSFRTNIAEIMGTKNATDTKSIDYLIEQQNKAIKDEVENAIKIAQEHKSDHFGILTKFILKYPLLRDYLDKNWKDLYPDIKFVVTVKSNIKGTYLLNEPTGGK